MARWLIASLLLLGSLFAPVPLVTAQGPVVDPPVDLNITMDPPRSLTWWSPPFATMYVNATCPTPALYTGEVVLQYELRVLTEWGRGELRDDAGMPTEDRLYFGDLCLARAVTYPLVLYIDGRIQEHRRNAYEEAHFEIVVNQSGAEPVVVPWTMVVGWSGIIRYRAEPYLVDTADGGKAIRLTVTNHGNGPLMVRPALWRDETDRPETTNTSVLLASPRDAPEPNQVTVDVPYTAVGDKETIAIGVLGEPVQDPGRIVAEFRYYVEVDPDNGHVRSLEDSFDLLPGPGIAPALALLGLAALALRRRVHT